MGTGSRYRLDLSTRANRLAKLKNLSSGGTLLTTNENQTARQQAVWRYGEEAHAAERQLFPLLPNIPLTVSSDVVPSSKEVCRC